MKFTYNFERTEEKYLISISQQQLLLEQCQIHLEEDEFKDFIVHNIYYDTLNDYLLRHSISKTDFKEKLRLRGYNTLEYIFLEKKIKFEGTVYKRRVKVQLDNITHLPIIKSSNNQIENEMVHFVQRYHPLPKYYLGYRRVAYKGLNEKNLRLTFDTNITYRFDNLDIRYGLHGQKLIDSDQVVMEIKTSDGIPLWLVKTLNQLKIFPTSYSKVGNIYMKEIIKKGDTL